MGRAASRGFYGYGGIGLEFGMVGFEWLKNMRLPLMTQERFAASAYGLNEGVCFMRFPLLDAASASSLYARVDASRDKE